MTRAARFPANAPLRFSPPLVSARTRTADARDPVRRRAAGRTVVFGGKARRSGVRVDDRYVADSVAKHPESLIGSLSVDPTQVGWQRQLEEGHKGLVCRQSSF